MARAARECALNDLDFTAIVRPGDTVVLSTGAGEPAPLVARLIEQRAAIGRFTLFLGGSYSGLIRPEHADHIDFVGIGGVGQNRELCRAGVMSILPAHYSEVANLFERGLLRADVVLMQLSAENAEGALSYGANVGYMPSAMRHARTVVAEINDQAPWTAPLSQVSRDDADILVRTSHAVQEVPSDAPDPVEEAIARHAGAFIGDGAIVQTGVGKAPGAILSVLADRRNLGLHSGIVGDSLIELIESGALTNATQPVHRGMSVTGGLLGTKRLYDFASGRRDILMAPVTTTHNARVIAALPKFTAINSAIEVDLTGQAAAEVIDGVYLGTIGGQVDFVRGALASEGGRAITGLPSRARGKPKIVARIASGVVTTARSDADVFVTEYGAAELRGQTLKERMKRMIAIAHPDDREGLEREGRDLIAGL